MLRTGPAVVTFITHPGFATQILACMLDSLVRVSRRVDEVHFASVLGVWRGPWLPGRDTARRSAPPARGRYCPPRRPHQAPSRSSMPPRGGAHRSIPRSPRLPPSSRGYKRPGRPRPARTTFPGRLLQPSRNRRWPPARPECPALASTGDPGTRLH